MAAWDGLTLWAGALVIRSRKRELVDFPASPSYTLEPPSNRGLAYPSASPHRSLSCVGSTGMLTRFPSATPFGLALGPTNPERIDLPQETLDFRRAGFSPALSLLVPAGSLPSTPPVLAVWLQRKTERSSRASPASIVLPNKMHLPCAHSIEIVAHRVR